MKRTNDDIKANIVANAIILALMLLAFGVYCLFADEPKLTIDGKANSGIYTFQEFKVTYSPCDICKRDIPNGMMVNIHIPQGFWGDKQKIAFKEIMLPYAKTEYHVCWRCVLEALKVPPDGGLK